MSPFTKEQLIAEIKTRFPNLTEEQYEEILALQLSGSGVGVDYSKNPPEVVGPPKVK